MAYRVKSDTIFSSGIMIRVAKTEAIEDQYNKRYIRFGCPSNWINYAEKNSDNGVADRYEAVFAHAGKCRKLVFKDFNENLSRYKISLRSE